MNPGTGKIITDVEFQSLFQENRQEADKFVQIEDDEMTSKQVETKQVSKHDNKSMLGKRCASYRKGRNKNK